MAAARSLRPQGLAHECNEAAETDGCQCRITQEANHRCVDDVEEILRYHAPDDGQGQGQPEYAMAACHVHDFLIVPSFRAAALAGDDYDLDFDYLI